MIGYKGNFSIVQLAVVDADNWFRVVDVGTYYRNRDGGALSNSAFVKALRTFPTIVLSHKQNTWDLFLMCLVEIFHPSQANI